MAQSPQPMESQVTLDAETRHAGFGVAFDNAAMQETLLGQLGSSIAQSSANALSTKLGYDEGENPHGDLLPPITQADKHYKAAYESQSKNTLSLQINKMLSDAQTELSNTYRLTPEMIAKFQKEIGEGTAQIIQNAPTGVKQELGSQYANAIINTTGALNRRLLAQNKDEAISRMKLADKDTDTSILDNAALGKADLAKQLYEQKVAQNKKQRQTGMMTPLEEGTSNTSAKLSYYTGLSNAKAIVARNAKGDELGKYLTSLADIKNKPDDLSVSEWNTIGNNTLSLMRHMDALQQVDKNTIISDLNEKLAAHTLTEQDVLTAYESPSFNKSDLDHILTKLYTQRSNGPTKEQKITDLVSNFTNRQAFGENGGETINSAYSQLVAAEQKKNPELGPMEAESKIASIAGGPIPRFLNTVANLSQSSNLDDVMAASNAYHRVHAYAPENVIGLNEDAYNFLNAFDSFRQRNPGDPMTALSQTRNALIVPTKEEKEIIRTNWNEIYRKKYSTPSQRSSLAREILGVNSFFNSTNVQDKNVADTHIANLLQKNFMLFRGDLQLAKESLQKQAANIYGDTWVNGRHEIGYLSLEKLSNLGQSSTHFIQRDIVKQLENPFAQYKEAYDKGYSDFFYRVKNPEKWTNNVLPDAGKRFETIGKRVSEINQELKDIHKQGYFESINNEDRYQSLQNERTKLLNEQNEIGRNFNKIESNPGVIEIEKVYRGNPKAQTLRLAVIPETNTTLSYDNAQPVIGNYFIKLITANGGLQNLDAINGVANAPIFYSPDFASIKNDYTRFKSMTGAQQIFNQQLDEYLASKINKRAK